MDKSEKICKWLNSHRLFSIRGMCTLIKIDSANFSRYVSSEKIPEKYIPKIEKVLKDYGY